MDELSQKSHTPDVLTCLANLSNDEVFTSPEVANQMLDLLPDDLWHNPNATFLDPACKTGIFLREIAKRLMVGLQDQIPDLQKRVDHIFQKQLYGIAITELTSLLSRRSVYCSKYPNSPYSITAFETAEGNIRFRRVEHPWQNGKCPLCGASKAEYARLENLETHAYEWIHTLHPKELFGMKFDVIIGNPPYQLSDGGFGDSAKPIYHYFVQQAIKLSPRYLTMIIPARWYSGGKGLDSFRHMMLHDNRIQNLHDFPETSDCFPNVNIRGGVCYFLWNRDYHGNCTIINYRSRVPTSSLLRPLLEDKSETFIRYNQAISILRKVRAHHESTMETLVSSRKPFGLPTNFKDYEERISQSKNTKVYKNGGIGFMSRKLIEKNIDIIDKIKLIVAKASPGSDEYPHLVFSEPIIAVENTVCTETYLIVNVVNTVQEAIHLKQYMATKFFRFLVLLVKNTQDVPKRVYSYVPQQTLDKVWSDKALYSKYQITSSEIAFIESLVKDVDWSKE